MCFKVSKTFGISRRGSWSKASRARREGRKEDRSATSVLHKIRPRTNFSDPPLCRDRLCLESSSRSSWELSCLSTFYTFLGPSLVFLLLLIEEEGEKKKIIDVWWFCLRELNWVGTGLRKLMLYKSWNEVCCKVNRSIFNIACM